ncbi:MAG: hypothetical protein K0S18_1326 [Anaerocolumna sp.]|nr:hypothetical protein [Anaerocolumna sp.]
MSYITVNEELRIKSCSIEDLSQETKEMFVKQFNGDPIESLTLFYDQEADTVVLNRDNKDYNLYELTAIAYLDPDNMDRASIRVKAKELIKETADLLERVVSEPRYA